MFGGVAFALLGVLLLLSAFRTFTSTEYQSLFDLLPINALGVTAFIVFGSSLVGLATQGLGPRRAIAWTGGLLAVGTLVATAIHQEWVVLIASAVALSAGTQWFAFVQAARPPDRPTPLAVALPAGLAIDLVLRAAFATVRVVDLPVVASVPLVVVAALLFLASGIAATGDDLAWTRPGLRGAIALVALPSLLVVAETGGLNGAQAAAAAGLGLDGGPSTEIGTLAVGIGVAVGAIAVARALPQRALAAAALGIGAALLWAHLPGLSLLGGAILGAGCVVGAAVLPSGPVVAARSATVAVIALGLGWIALVGTAFLFYGFYAYPPGAWAATALALAGALVVPPSPLTRLRAPLAAAIVALAVVVPAAWLALTPMPTTVPAPATFRVMTYNLHQGFDAGQIPALDRQVETIAQEQPDIVVVEEAVRGWLIDDQQDVLGYLSTRLGLPYVFDPNIGDLYGNAILSRFPVTGVRRISYPKEPGMRYQPRGAILAHIGGVLIIGTHLDHNADASAVRLEQVRLLLREWNGEQPVLLLCDCNARPEAAELKLIDDSGLGDVGLAAGAREPTSPADTPSERIDYIFGAGVTASQGHVVASTASDHRAVVVNITVRR